MNELSGIDTESEWERDSNTESEWERDSNTESDRESDSNAESDRESDSNAESDRESDDGLEYLGNDFGEENFDWGGFPTHKPTVKTNLNLIEDGEKNRTEKKTRMKKMMTRRWVMNCRMKRKRKFVSE